MKSSLKSTLGVGAVGVAFIVGAVYWASASESVPISEVSHIHGLSVDRSDPSRLYLATHYGLWRTAPNGTASRISDNTDDYMGFTPRPGDPDVFYVSGHPQGGGNAGFLSSRDTGRTWEQVAPGVGGPADFHAMDASAVDPDVIYGVYGEVQSSLDGGKTWSIAGSPPAQVIDIATSPESTDRLYAATGQGVMVSKDGAKTWQATGPNGQATMVQAAEDGTIYAFIVGQGLVAVKNGIDKWEILSTAFGDRFLLHLAADPANYKRLYAVTQKSEIITSSNGGVKWLPLGHSG